MSTGVQWYSMVQHAMVQRAMVHRPMFEPGEMLCMGRAGLPGTQASSSSVLGGGSPGGHWPHTGTTTHYRGTVTSHLAVIAAAVAVLERLQ